MARKGTRRLVKAVGVGLGVMYLLVPKQGAHPAMRMLGGVLGGGLLAQALRRPGVLNLFVGTLGVGLLTRAATNGQTSRQRGLVESGQGVRVRKSITVDAPIEEVYRRWTSYEQFPRFLRNVQEVKDLGGGRSAWTMAVAAPLAARIRFNAVVTQQRPNALFAWKTEEGEPVAHVGQLRFERHGERSTTVHVEMSYTRPAGAAGHLVASLFGADPQREMEEDLLRMKAFLETGRTEEEPAKPLL